MLRLFKRKEAPPVQRTLPLDREVVPEKPIEPKPAVTVPPKKPAPQRPRKAAVAIFDPTPADDFDLAKRNRRLTLDLAEADRQRDIAIDALRKIADGSLDARKLAVSALAKLGVVSASPEPEKATTSKHPHQKVA